MPFILIRGVVAEKGYGHFSQCRPRFYDSVEKIEGRKLRPGTINIRVNGAMPIPSKEAIRVEGLDDIDLRDNQDILITPVGAISTAGIGFFQFSRAPRHLIPWVTTLTR